MFISADKHKMFVYLIPVHVKNDDFMLAGSPRDSVLRRLTKVSVPTIGLLLNCFDSIYGIVNMNGYIKTFIRNEVDFAFVSLSATDGLHSATTSEGEHSDTNYRQNNLFHSLNY